MINKEMIERASKIYLDSYNGFQIHKNRKFVNLFEKSICEKLGANQEFYGVATNSCDSSLIIALKSLNLKQGDEVIIPAYSFVSTLNILLNNQIKPIFVDVSEYNLGLDASQIVEKITAKTKAIIVVHLFGIQAGIVEITRLAHEYGIPVIEDCAQAFGSKINGQFVGTFADIACFSFNRNKILSSEEGGLVISKNMKYISKARILVNNGIDIDTQTYYEAGYSFRMTDWQACLLLEELKVIDDEISRNRILSKMIHETLDSPKFKDYYNNEAVYYRYPIKIRNIKNSNELAKVKFNFLFHNINVLLQQDYTLPMLINNTAAYSNAEVLKTETIKLVLEDNIENVNLYNINEIYKK